MHDPYSAQDRRGRALDVLERIAPWIMIGLIAALLFAGVVGTLRGAPWRS